MDWVSYVPSCSAPPACAAAQAGQCNLQNACSAEPPLFDLLTQPRATPLSLCSRASQDADIERSVAGLKCLGAVLASPALLGLCSGEPRLEDVGVDPGDLPRELLAACKELGLEQLAMDGSIRPQATYQGPVTLLKEAFVATESRGSTSVLLAALDNTSMIHGVARPMLAVLAIGDAELVIMRRGTGVERRLETAFSLDELRRLNRREGALTAQLTREDTGESIDPSQVSPLDMIETESIVRCVSLLEEDIILLCSASVFASLGTEGLLEICNEVLYGRQPGQPGFSPAMTQAGLIEELAESLVFAAQARAVPEWLSRRAAGDASVVVAEAVSWNRAKRGASAAHQSTPFDDPEMWQCSADCGSPGRDKGFFTQESPEHYIFYDGDPAASTKSL